MRTNRNIGPQGNQCTYDSKGKLLTSPPAAGSVDWFSPTYDKGLHWDHDVAPFFLAARLNRISDYYLVRPSW